MPIYFQGRTEATDSLLTKITAQERGDWYFTFTGRDSELPTLRIMLLRETVTKSQTIKKEKNVWTIRLDFEEKSWGELFERSAKYPLVFECMLNENGDSRGHSLFVLPVFLPAKKEYSIETKNISPRVRKSFDAIQIKTVKKNFGTRLLIRMREK